MNLVAIVAAIGAVLTMAVCVRLIIALRRNEAHDAIIGWFALMICIPVIVFAIDQLAAG